LPRKSKWSNAQLREAVKSQKTLRGVARELGLTGTQNYEWLKKKIKIAGLKQKTRWKDEDLISLLPNCHSIMEVCKNLGFESRNQAVKDRIIELELDTTHFYDLRQGVESLFKQYDGRRISRKKIAYVHKKCLEVGKKRGILGKKCYFCGAVLELPKLYHLDVDIYNNTPQNIVVVCERCLGI